MRQVPRKTPYGVVGDGKVARHFIHYFDLLGLSRRQWSRRALHPVTEVLAEAEVVLLLIRDSALESFIAETPCLSGKTLIHFSGSLVVPGAIGFHPLMTFGQELYPLATYESVPFVCESGTLAFKDVFPELSNPHYLIAPELKPFYHALCVMSGNFTVLLWQKFFIELQSKLGIPWQAGLPYLKQITENLAKNPETALTGPIQRKDYQTIEKNIESLSGDAYQRVYQAFVEASK